MKRLIISTRPSEKGFPEMNLRCIMVRNIPLTKIRPFDYSSSLEKRIKEFNPNILVFTSEIGVKIFLNEYPEIVSEFGGTIFGIGEKTADTLKNAGFATLFPAKKDSPGLAELVAKHAHKDDRIALIRSKNASAILPDILNKKGISVKDFHVYEVVRSHESELLGKIIFEPGFSGIIITSPMEADILSQVVERKTAAKIPIYAIGTTTRARLESLGLSVMEPHGESNFNELVEKIILKLCK